MPIYDESKMKQKVVYPTKQTPSYADWALFYMGKELESHGGAYDPAQDVIVRTAMGIKTELLDDISLELTLGIPTHISYSDETYAVAPVEDTTYFAITDETDDSLVGYLFIYGARIVGTYIGINTDVENERYVLYGQITEITTVESEE